MSEVAQLPAKAVQAPSPIVAGGAVKAIVPQSMDDAYRLAKAVCMSGLAPRGLEKPEAAMVAIMHGLEIGLTPMMALQKIAVINGRPTLWGDGALGLVRGSGLCKYLKETITGKDDARVATCETLRAGEPEPIVRTFAVADAKRAGLWGKSGPWQQFPERMLQMRARAFALRDGYADVLGGMYLAEELQGTEPAQNGRATIVDMPATASTPTPAAAKSARLAPPPPPPITKKEAPEPVEAQITEAEERALDRASMRAMNGEAPHDPETGEIVPDDTEEWVFGQIEEADAAKSLAVLETIDDQVCTVTDDKGREDLRGKWNAAFTRNRDRLRSRK